MTNEEKILSTLAELSDRIEQGFAGMNSRFAEMEDRLTKQEQKTRKTAARQQLQSEQIRQLTECVRELAAQEPIWHGRSETAIQKDRPRGQAVSTGGAQKGKIKGKTKCQRRAVIFF